MNNYLAYFFNPIHLFSLRPGAIHNNAAMILAIVFGACIAAAIVSSVMGKQTKDGLKIKVYQRLMHLFLTTGILGFVYLFFALEGVVILSGRFLLVTIGIVAIVWLGFILKYLFTAVPKLRRNIEEKRKFQKYIP